MKNDALQTSRGTRGQHSPQAIEDAAADWLVRRHEGFAPGEQDKFRAWLAHDPSHAAVFAGLEAVWETLNQPRKSGEAGVARRELRVRAQRRSRRRIRVAGAVMGVAAAVVLLFTLSPS